MKSKKVAVYLGSFDPVTFGHLDVIQRAASIFDELVVGVGKNSSKKFFFSEEDRFLMMEKECAAFPKVKVRKLSGLAIDFAKNHGASVIVRGLRTEADYAYEMRMAMINKALAEDLHTIFIPTSQNLSHISSRLVKEVASYGGDVSSFVPKSAIEKLKPKV